MIARWERMQGPLLGVGKAVAFLAALNFFFVSISLLGAFKDLGAGYGEILIQQLAANPLLGLMLGVFVTASIQSSSTTTAIVVALVAGGAFGEDGIVAMQMAVPVIMGANVGTSVTNLLVSMVHIGNRREFERAFSAAVVHDFFNVLAVIIFLPVELLTGFFSSFSLWLAESFAAIGGMTFISPLKLLVVPQTAMVGQLFEHDLAVKVMVLFIGFLALYYSFGWIIGQAVNPDGKKRRGASVILAALFAVVTAVSQHYAEFIFAKPTATFLFGLVLLFAMLMVIVKVMRSAVMGRLEGLFHTYVFKTWPRAMFVGMVVTAMVQSSSVTTSLLVPLAGAGILSIEQIFPYDLGANVGTTITAMLAALATGQVMGIAVAFAHLLFNALGIVVIFPARRFPIGLAKWFSSKASHSKAVPIGFVIGLYILVPLVLILIFR